MDILVYKMEFSYWCGADGYKTVRITALTMFSMLRAFRNEIDYIRTNSPNTRKETIKQLWNKESKLIIKEKLQFPFVNWLNEEN